MKTSIAFFGVAAVATALSGCGATSALKDPAGTLRGAKDGLGTVVRAGSQVIDTARGVMNSDDKVGEGKKALAEGVNAAQGAAQGYIEGQTEGFTELAQEVSSDIAAIQKRPVIAYQKALNAKGCDAGVADGVIGTGTKDAHTRLETINGVKIKATAAAVKAALKPC